MTSNKSGFLFFLPIQCKNIQLWNCYLKIYVTSICKVTLCYLSYLSCPNDARWQWYDNSRLFPDVYEVGRQKNWQLEKAEYSNNSKKIHIFKKTYMLKSKDFKKYQVSYILSFWSHG